MFFNRNDRVGIAYTEGISRISENADIKNVRSDDDQNNNNDSNESVEDLVSELFNYAFTDDSEKRGEEDIDRSGE
jgi:hypothetical protein